MRRILYGAGVVMTTDDVADALLQLASALANLGQTERVTIPVAVDVAVDPAGDASHETVDVIVGPGIALMSQRVSWTHPPPDFSTSATLMRMHPAYPYPPSRAQQAQPAHFEVDDWDPDLDGY